MKVAFIKLHLSDVKEAEPVAEGEYDLRIVKVDDRVSKSGNPMTEVIIRIEDAGVSNPAPLRHYLVYPDDSTPSEQRQFRLLDIKRFLQMFGIQIASDGFDSESLLGATGRGMVVQEEGDDRNIYNRLRLPRLRE